MKKKETITTIARELEQEEWISVLLAVIALTVITVSSFIGMVVIIKSLVGMMGSL